MLKGFIALVFLTALTAISMPTFAGGSYGRKICSGSKYTCYRVKGHDTWERLFPNPLEKEIVKRVNRINTLLRRGMIIAIPKNLSTVGYMDVSPFPRRIEPRGYKFVLISVSLHAFGAYDKFGYLLHWGPISGGKGWCPDLGSACNTPIGTFHMKYKGNANCVSKKFPVGIGGAPMYYCMFFYGGYAMHSSFLPGHHASHGCIRLFHEDAKWLNENFITTGKDGTKVIVKAALIPMKERMGLGIASIQVV
jgi:L,D-transpeptidase ErfK/SrfK